METSELAKQYLSEIGEKATEYYEALEFTKDYVIRNTDMNNENVIDCMLMSILWVASKRGDELTEEDVCMFLNVDSEIEHGDITVQIVPEMQGWSLEEVLEYVNGQGTL